SLSYLALRDTDALAVATFVSPNRLGYPPARSAREKLLGRIDALVALSDEVRAAAEQRFPGDYRVLSPGVDTELFTPKKKRKTIVVELRANGDARAARPARMGARPPAHAAPDRAARDSARARGTRAHAHRARLAHPRDDPRRGCDLRARNRGASPGDPRGEGSRLRDRAAGRRRGAARA